MDAGSAQCRGKRARGDSSRAGTAGPRAQTRDRALNAIQKAIASNTDSQANIRQGGRGSNLEQVSVRGWKQSKAASNRDGGLESLITFLEKKLNTHDSKAGSRARITKVCATLDMAVTGMNSQLRPLGVFSFSGMVPQNDDRHLPRLFLASVPLDDCGFEVSYALLTFISRGFQAALS
jgi:nuclear RNA export factor